MTFLTEARTMDIYFCGSISGGRNYVDTYQDIVEYLKSLGHRVLTEHVAHPKVLELENKFTDEYIYHRDIKMLEECQCVIAEVSTPSLGVGYEICYALSKKKPTLCLYLEGVFLTRMLIGNTSEGLVIKEYESSDDWAEIIDEFLDTVKKKGRF